jgi:hypothetical protein
MTTIHQTEKEYWLLPKGCRSTIRQNRYDQKPLVSAFERKNKQVANEGIGLLAMP